MPSLPEDLVILAVGAKPRGGPNNGKLPWRFQYGIRGAVLVSLTLAGRVEVADGEILVRDPRPLGDPNLDEALAGLAAVRATPVAEWMANGPAGFVTAYFDRMEAAGVLRSETVWLLFIARRKGYRLADPGYFGNLRAALYTAVTGPGPVEPGMAALAGLAFAGDIVRLVFPGRQNAPLHARFAELAGQDPAMTAPGSRSGTTTSDDPFLHATQAAVHSAVHHSVHAAVSAATTTSHHHGGSSSGAIRPPRTTIIEGARPPVLRGGRPLCDCGVVEDWIEVAWSAPADIETARADLDAALDAFLSRRGLSRADLAEDDLRIDLVYLGPGGGGCGRRLMIRTTAMPPEAGRMPA